MYVHRYDITFEEGIAMLEGPIAYLMFEQNSKNQCPSLYMFPMAGVFRWFIYTNAKVYGIPQIYIYIYILCVLRPGSVVHDAMISQFSGSSGPCMALVTRAGSVLAQTPWKLRILSLQLNQVRHATSVELQCQEIS